MVDEDGRAPYGVDMRRPEQAKLRIECWQVKPIKIVFKMPLQGTQSQVKVYSSRRQKKPYAEAVGPDWRAGAGARVWSPLPPGPSKRPGVR